MWLFMPWASDGVLIGLAWVGLATVVASVVASAVRLARLAFRKADKR